MADLAFAITGMQAAQRVASENSNHYYRTMQKHATDLSWQVAGTGKAVNSSLKELLISLGKVLGQVDSSTSKETKLLEAQNTVLPSISESLKTSEGIKKVGDNTGPPVGIATTTPITPAKLGGASILQKPEQASMFPPPPPGFSVPPAGGSGVGSAVAPKLMPVTSVPPVPVPPPAPGAANLSSLGSAGFDPPAAGDDLQTYADNHLLCLGGS